MGSRGVKKTYTQEDWMPAVRRWVLQYETVTPEDRAAIEAFIAESPGVTNKLSRGIALSDEQLSKLQVGTEFSEKKLASWTTRVGIAQAAARDNYSESTPNQVILRLDDGTDLARKVGRFGGRRYDEGEAIMSSRARFVVVKIKRERAVNGYTTVWVKRK